LPISFAYTYNDANQRLRVTQQDGSYWVYDYDALGQVKSGKRYWSDNTPVAGQQFEYGFDDIGNRMSTKAGGDSRGMNLRSASYTANNVNHYTQRDVPGGVDVIGLANASATVTVNANSPYRRGEYFRQELSIDNSSSAQWQDVTTIASLSGTSVTNTGNLFVPKTAEAFLYDADGNLTNDGRWMYTWDGENRLIEAESQTSAPTASKRKVEYSYDCKGRLSRRVEYDGSSGSYSLTNDVRFTYDGLQCLAELNGSSELLRSYVWGLDLSGTRTGAGGVGGLLAMNSAAAGVHFYGYDGNGNVVSLVGAAAGAESAMYDYEPFGQTLRLTGSAAAENSFRFSTKRIDPTGDASLFEMRAYRPGIGWLSRDPIEERGGRNLYCFVDNSPLSHTDSYGKKKLKQKSIFEVDIETYHYYSAVIIGFRSGWRANGCIECQNVKLAQIYSTIYEDLWGNLTHSDSWKLDADPQSPPWYPFQQSQFGYVSMHDAPGMRWYYPVIGSQLYGVTQMFETCAWCVDKEDLRGRL
jgi:RHS repeat-associated protein